MRLRLALGNVADQPADVAVRIAPAALVARSADLLLARAGPEIEAACRALHRESFPDGIPVGEAVITRGGDLLAPWLVHVVVPGYVVTHDRSYQLSAAYRACLREADSVGARTLAMPALGAWSPIWPLVDAETADFTIATMPARFAAVGDRHATIDDVSHDLTPLLEWYERDERDKGEGDMPYPPNYPKMPGEPMRVQPSKAKN